MPPPPPPPRSQVTAPAPSLSPATAGGSAGIAHGHLPMGPTQTRSSQQKLPRLWQDQNNLFPFPALEGFSAFWGKKNKTTRKKEMRVAVFAASRNVVFLRPLPGGGGGPHTLPSCRGWCLCASCVCDKYVCAWVCYLCLCLCMGVAECWGCTGMLGCDSVLGCMGAQESWHQAPACSGNPNVSRVPLVLQRSWSSLRSPSSWWWSW